MRRDAARIVARQNRDSNRANDASFRRFAAMYGGVVAIVDGVCIVTVPSHRFDLATHVFAVTHSSARVVSLGA